MKVYTYQDFEAAADKPEFIGRAIRAHKSGQMYETAVLADEYDHQRNPTITRFVQTLFTQYGTAVPNRFASNSRIASNYFSRLNTQRCAYSLGNGVSFAGAGENDDVKAVLGNDFDHDLYKWAYAALIHGVAFGFLNLDRLLVFEVTEAVPLWDAYSGTLRGLIRFWQLDEERPLSVTVYEEDGYTQYVQERGQKMRESEPKRAYKTEVESINGVDTVVGESNYSGLPIVPMWGSRLHQSTLVGMREAIDSYDLIRSGLANSIRECATCYWIMENSSGMDDNDLMQFRDRLLTTRIANIDSAGGSKVTPYTADIPTEAHKVYLDAIRAEIYESFGALDVHTVAAGATNDHIDAAYQPLDENADDFEYQVSEALRQLLRLAGYDVTPIFKRNRISNQKEQVEMVMLEAPYLDRATILSKLPNITIDEVQTIIDSSDDADMRRIMGEPAE